MSKKEGFVTVTELNNLIKDTITNTFTDIIKLKGEISNIKSSGAHTYLTLKDENTAINVTMWNTKISNLKNGDDVMATGKLTCYPKMGIYQLIANKIDRIGEGALHELLEQNKKLFESKGYFSKSKKIKPIPTQINRIGILTASEGAALQDILYVLKSNSFGGEILIKNCSVQGQYCPKSVSDGIEYFNELHKTKHLDVLIIARGGGSFEDLIGYSSKEIVKAIHSTKIYTISAIGHEVDNMLSDMSANLRAPTPSVAGELVSSSQKMAKEKIKQNIENLSRLRIQIKNKLTSINDTINSNKKILSTINPTNFVNNELERLNKLKTFVHNKTQNKLINLINQIEKLKLKNETFNPANIFENGYVAIVDESNNLVNNLTTFENLVSSQQKLKIIFANGEFELSESILSKSSKPSKSSKSNVKK